MIVKRIGLAGVLMTLMAAQLSAVAAGAPPGGPPTPAPPHVCWPSSTPTSGPTAWCWPCWPTPVAASNRALTRNCGPHEVRYVAEGRLVSQTLVANADGTFSGDVTVAVKHGNRFGRPGKDQSVTYAITNAKVIFRPKDISGIPAGLGNLADGDRVRVMGEVTPAGPGVSPAVSTGPVTVTKVVFRLSRVRSRRQQVRGK